MFQIAAKPMVGITIQSATYHEIGDEILETFCLGQHGRQESMRLLWRDLVELIDQRFHVADDRGERRPQFVARVGYKVGMSSADVDFRGAVDELDQRKPLVERLS